MPVCSAGSEIQPGLPTTVVVDPLFALGLLGVWGLDWLRPFIPFLQPITLNMGDFCELDPPADPSFGLEDAFALVTPNRYELTFVASQKLTQLVHILLWYRWCRCIDLATPTPFTPPTEPTGLPVINPQPYVGPGTLAEPCVTSSHHMETTYGVSTLETPRENVGGDATTCRATVNLHSAGFAIGCYLVESTAATGGTTVEHSIGSQLADNGTFYNGLGVAGSHVTDVTLDVTKPYKYLRFTSSGTTGDHTGTSTADVVTEYFCGTVPGGTGPTTLCESCPPDPFLQAQLSLIRSALEYVRGQLDLVQRQAVPFGYVPGDLHTAISGAGELTVADLIGAKISITATTAGTIGSAAGNPERLFGAGYVQWGSADGFSTRVWLDQVDTLTFPAAAGAYTLLAYSLPPGVVVEILELEREP